MLNKYKNSFYCQEINAPEGAYIRANSVHSAAERYVAECLDTTNGDSVTLWITDAETKKAFEVKVTVKIKHDYIAEVLRTVE